MTGSGAKGGASPRSRERPQAARQDDVKPTHSPDIPQPDRAESHIPFEEVQPSVLLVDDNVGFCVAMEGIMGASGFELTYATSVVQAQEYLRALSYDAAVLDWQLDRGRDGLKLLTQIRRDGWGLPVVFTTLFDADDIEVQARSAGADAYVSKENARQLAVVVRDLVGQFRSRGPWSALREIVTRHRLVVSEMSKYTRKAIGRMCTGMRQSLDIGELVRAAGEVTEGHFTRVFQQDTGLPPTGFLAELRIETAIPLLRDTDLSHPEIAKQLGFGSLKNLRRTFLKHVGRLPRDFRNNEERG